MDQGSNTTMERDGSGVVSGYRSPVDSVKGFPSSDPHGQYDIMYVADSEGNIRDSKGEIINSYNGAAKELNNLSPEQNGLPPEVQADLERRRAKNANKPRTVEGNIVGLEKDTYAEKFVNSLYEDADPNNPANRVEPISNNQNKEELRAQKREEIKARSRVERGGFFKKSAQAILTVPFMPAMEFLKRKAENLEVEAAVKAEELGIENTLGEYNREEMQNSLWGRFRIATGLMLTSDWEWADQAYINGDPNQGLTNEAQELLKTQNLQGGMLKTIKGVLQRPKEMAQIAFGGFSAGVGVGSYLAGTMAGAGALTGAKTAAELAANMTIMRSLNLANRATTALAGGVNRALITKESSVAQEAAMALVSAPIGFLSAMAGFQIGKELAEETGQGAAMMLGRIGTGFGSQMVFLGTARKFLDKTGFAENHPEFAQNMARYMAAGTAFEVLSNDWVEYILENDGNTDVANQAAEIKNEFTQSKAQGIYEGLDNQKGGQGYENVANRFQDDQGNIFDQINERVEANQQAQAPQQNTPPVVGQEFENQGNLIGQGTETITMPSNGNVLENDVNNPNIFYNREQLTDGIQNNDIPQAIRVDLATNEFSTNGTLLYYDSNLGGFVGEGEALQNDVAFLMNDGSVTFQELNTPAPGATPEALPQADSTSQEFERLTDRESALQREINQIEDRIDRLEQNLEVETETRVAGSRFGFLDRVSANNPAIADAIGPYEERGYALEAIKILGDMYDEDPDGFKRTFEIPAGREVGLDELNIIAMRTLQNSGDYYDIANGSQSFNNSTIQNHINQYARLNDNPLQYDLQYRSLNNALENLDDGGSRSTTTTTTTTDPEVRREINALRSELRGLNNELDNVQDQLDNLGSSGTGVENILPGSNQPPGGQGFVPPTPEMQDSFTKPFSVIFLEAGYRTPEEISAAARELGFFNWQRIDTIEEFNQAFIDRFGEEILEYKDVLDLMDRAVFNDVMEEIAEIDGRDSIQDIDANDILNFLQTAKEAGFAEQRALELYENQINQAFIDGLDGRAESIFNEELDDDSRLSLIDEVTKIVMEQETYSDVGAISKAVIEAIEHVLSDDLNYDERRAAYIALYGSLFAVLVGLLIKTPRNNNPRVGAQANGQNQQGNPNQPANNNRNGRRGIRNPFRRGQGSQQQQNPQNNQGQANQNNQPQVQQLQNLLNNLRNARSQTEDSQQVQQIDNSIRALNDAIDVMNTRRSQGTGQRQDLADQLIDSIKTSLRSLNFQNDSLSNSVVGSAEALVNAMNRYNKGEINQQDFLDIYSRTGIDIGDNVEGIRSGGEHQRQNPQRTNSSVFRPTGGSGQPRGPQEGRNNAQASPSAKDSVNEERRRDRLGAPWRAFSSIIRSFTGSQAGNSPQVQVPNDSLTNQPLFIQRRADNQMILNPEVIQQRINNAAALSNNISETDLRNNQSDILRAVEDAMMNFETLEEYERGIDFVERYFRRDDANIEGFLEAFRQEYPEDLIDIGESIAEDIRQFDTRRSMSFNENETRPNQLANQDDNVGAGTRLMILSDPDDPDSELVPNPKFLEDKLIELEQQGLVAPSNSQLRSFFLSDLIDAIQPQVKDAVDYRRVVEYIEELLNDESKDYNSLELIKALKDRFIKSDDVGDESIRVVDEEESERFSVRRAIKQEFEDKTPLEKFQGYMSKIREYYGGQDLNYRRLFKPGDTLPGSNLNTIQGNYQFVSPQVVLLLGLDRVQNYYMQLGNLYEEYATSNGEEKRAIEDHAAKAKKRLFRERDEELKKLNSEDADLRDLDFNLGSYIDGIDEQMIYYASSELQKNGINLTINGVRNYIADNTKVNGDKTYFKDNIDKLVKQLISEKKKT